MLLKKYSLPLKLLSSLIALIVLIVTLEQLTRLAHKRGWIEYQRPMITLLPRGTEDWRRAHMTADNLREPDPVLWWRPKNTSPYNKQGFKGPLAEIPKPANTFRILVYGDSNTEGIPEDSWPARLQLVLNEFEKQSHLKYEVLNAGVAGYTSHQGFIRFQQEVEKFAPDMVLVAFGWNDLARGVQPDRHYRPPAGWIVALERTFLKLHSYRALKQIARSKSHENVPKTVRRVPLKHYEDNLYRFASLAKKHNVKVVFLTRPHRDSVEQLQSTSSSFSAGVPEYNQELLRVARQNNVEGLDAEKYFLDAAEERFWGDECHFTELGRIEMAKFVFEELKKSGLF